MTNKNDNVTLEGLIKRVEHLEAHGVPGLLDFFASSALSELANSNKNTSQPAGWKAQKAYEIAVAMVEERKQYVG
jgi:hypothetical protein